MSRWTLAKAMDAKRSAQNAAMNNSTNSSSLDRQQLAPSQGEQLALLRNAFDAADKDKNGSIDQFELHTVLVLLGRSPDEAELRGMMAEADADGDGTIDFDEVRAS